MSVKTKAVDLLAEIQKTWHDLLKLQEALSQLKQFSAVARLSTAANEIASFIAQRAVEDAQREKAEKKIRAALDEATRLIKQAEETIAKLEGRAQKPARAKPVKTAPGQKVIRLTPNDGLILDTALQIIQAGQWDDFKAAPLIFLGKCFQGNRNQIFVLGAGKLHYKEYLDRGFFGAALARIVTKYREWFESQFALPVNERTGELFKLTHEKIGDADALRRTLFETMLGKSLNDVGKTEPPETQN